MIRWGKVEKIVGPKAQISLNSLKEEGLGYQLTVRGCSVPFDKSFVPGLQIGHIVAVHWNLVVKILTKKEEEKLSFWTKETLRLLF